MRVIVLLGLSLLVTACETAPVTPGAVQGGPRRVSLQFFLVYEDPGANVVERKVEATGETVYLAAQSELTENDIAWAEMHTDPITGRASVLTHFTIAGADRLAALTGRNTGRRLAIVLDGRIIATPLITMPIRDGRAVIEGFRSSSEAKQVADSLGRR